MSFTFRRLLQSPLPSRDNQVRWHAEIIMVIRFCCFQDCYSLICLPETIKSVGMQRQSWSSAFIIFKTIIVFFAFWRQSSLLLCGDNHVFRSLSFQRQSESFVETSMSPLLCKTSKSCVDIPDASYAFSFDRFG